jgi:hypothetical protein
VATSDLEPLEVRPVATVAAQAELCGWLIESLWSAQGVGWIAATPKSNKTWLALDLAISVCTGTDALGCFPVADRGPALFYGAEDSLPHLRERAAAIAQARQLTLTDLDLGLIDTPSLRLDKPRDLARLCKTIEQHGPRILILDPFVRLHTRDENDAGEISSLLGDLREIQRRYRLALMLVHHLRKKPAGHGQDGQSLRGSGDIHAWSDSALYLRRRDKHVIMTAEHRSAPSPPPCTLELTDDPAPHLTVVPNPADPNHDTATRQLADNIIAVLSQASRPVSRNGLRDQLRTRNASLGEALVFLRATGRIERSQDGFILRSAP